MTRRMRSFELNAIAALTRGLMVVSVLVLGAACRTSTGEPGPVEPIRVAPSPAETALRVRNDSHSTLVDVLQLILQRH